MNKKKIAIFLIVIGLLLLLNALNLTGTDISLYLISIGFFIAYFMLGAGKYYKNIGFLVPAAILMAVALYPDLQKLDFINKLGGGFFFIILGLAFIIVFIHSLAFKKWDWPLYPAIILTSFGILIILIENNQYFQKFEYLYYILAAFLIVLGLFLLYLEQKEE